MPTATILPFPAPITVLAVRAFHIDTGPGPVVAVLFRVHVDGVQRPGSAGDQEGGQDQAGDGVGAGE